MIRLTASLSKKVPLDGVDYASRGFTAGVEVEVTDLADVQGKLRDLYGLLETAIDAEIAGRPVHDQVPPARAIIPGNNKGWDTGANSRRNNGNGQRQRQQYRSDNGDHRGGNNNGRRRATDAQLKAIGAIAAASDMDERYLTDLIHERFNAANAGALTVREASALIDHLKQLQAA